jgi:hypothetical protein
MDFNLTKEQQDIVQAARKFAKGEFPDRANLIWKSGERPVIWDL